MAGTAAIVKFGWRDETQGAAEETDFAILVLAKSLLQRNCAKEVWAWNEDIRC